MYILNLRFCFWGIAVKIAGSYGNFVSTFRKISILDFIEVESINNHNYMSLKTKTHKSMK